MQISKHKVVSIDYTLTGDDGAVIDTSDGREPLAFIQGAGNIIPGLESALEGRGKGDELQVKIAPDQGYGERVDSLRQEVPKDRFEADSVEVGMQFHAHTDSGPLLVTVVDVDDENVTVDGNHPLAGVNLNFDVTVVDVRDATAEELDHGHVHGPGGHQH